MAGYTFLDNRLSVSDFVMLWRDAGWGDIPKDLVETALRNSYATFLVTDGVRSVGMARLLGDGAMSFFLKDFVIAQDLRGKGLGSTLLAHVEDYIRAQLKPGWKGYIQLVSAKDKEAFYEKNGYLSHPNADSGSAMSKWIG